VEPVAAFGSRFRDTDGVVDKRRLITIVDIGRYSKPVPRWVEQDFPEMVQEYPLVLSINFPG
jgi:hypothetical protein